MTVISIYSIISLCDRYHNTKLLSANRDVDIPQINVYGVIYKRKWVIMYRKVVHKCLMEHESEISFGFNAEDG